MWKSHEKLDCSNHFENNSWSPKYYKSSEFFLNKSKTFKFVLSEKIMQVLTSVNSSPYKQRSWLNKSHKSIYLSILSELYCKNCCNCCTGEVCTSLLNCRVHSHPPRVQISFNARWASGTPLDAAWWISLWASLK